jgi:hypothetical protein
MNSRETDVNLVDYITNGSAIKQYLPSIKPPKPTSHQGRTVKTHYVEKRLSETSLFVKKQDSVDLEKKLSCFYIAKNS